MTWIKPSLLWMMHRSNWASKPGQERILAIDILRRGFEWALSHSCLSSYDPQVYESIDEWRQCLSLNPVRIQWDPDRDLQLKPLRRRAIQIGLAGEAVRLYTAEWIVRITDYTELSKELSKTAQIDPEWATRCLPMERPYRLHPRLRMKIGAMY